MRDHLALDIPESLEIYEETTSGPDRKSSNNLRSLHRDLIWLHITKEEYGHLPGTVEHHPEDMEKHLGFKKVIKIPSNLRHPWRHITLSQHPLQAITATSWLISESRLYTSAPETSYLICFRPSTWHLAEAIKNGDINSWSRHEVGHHLQVINNSYDLDQDEIDSSRVFHHQGKSHPAHLWCIHVASRISLGLSHPIPCIVFGDIREHQVLLCINQGHSRTCWPLHPGRFVIKGIPGLCQRLHPEGHQYAGASK